MVHISTEELQGAVTDINMSWGLNPVIEPTQPEDQMRIALRAVGDMANVIDDLQVTTWRVLLLLDALLPTVAIGIRDRFPELEKVGLEEPVVAPEPVPEPVQESTAVSAIQDVQEALESAVIELPKTRKPRRVKTKKEVEAETPSQGLPKEVVSAIGSGVTLSDQPKERKRTRTRALSTERTYRSDVFELINEGLHSQKEVVAIVCSRYTHLQPATIRTYVTDCKNPTYTEFERVAYVDPTDKKLKFRED